MDKSLEILNFLENSTEEEKVYQVKNRFQLSSERNARAILHIFENSESAVKYEAKIAKLIKKLEEKYAKEAKRLQKRNESFFNAGYVDRSKLEEISGDIQELQKLMQ
jgi:predicted transcriptional regulator